MITTQYTSFLLALFLGVSNALSAMPTAFNYQGRLTDLDGNPASGSKMMELALYDAATGGRLVYREQLGTVQIGSEGIYSFTFGAAGESYPEVESILAYSNGSETNYTATLDPEPVATTLEVQDGSYAWSSAEGSSHPESFAVSFSSATRVIAVTYGGEAPAAGTAIELSYIGRVSGIDAALSASDTLWLELTIEGQTQVPRERVLAVPYARVAASDAAQAAGITANLERLQTLYARLSEPVETRGVLFAVYMDEKIHGTQTIEIGGRLLRSFMGQVLEAWGETIRITYVYEDGSEFTLDHVTPSNGEVHVFGYGNPHLDRPVERITFDQSVAGSIAYVPGSGSAVIDFSGITLGEPFLLQCEPRDGYAIRLQAYSEGGAFLAEFAPSGERYAEVPTGTRLGEVRVVWTPEATPSVVQIQKVPRVDLKVFDL